MATRVTTGGLSFICAKDGNPLFANFRLADAEDRLVRTVHCPACKTAYAVEVSIREPPVPPGP